MKSKKYLAIPILVALALVATVGATGSLVQPSNNGASVSEGPTYQGRVCAGVTRDGEYHDIGCTHNVLVDAGKNFITSEIGTGDTTNVLNYMALGKGSDPASGATALPSAWTTTDAVGLAPQLVTFTSTGVGNMSASTEWTATSDGVTVSNMGVQVGSNATAPTTFFAGADIVNVTLQTDDKLNGTYQIWVT